MTVKTGQAWAGLFVTLDATGALAAGSPAGVLYVDGVANAATVTITGSNPYKYAVTLPNLTAGQRVDMYITATISTIATAGIVASAQADTVLASDVKAETALILADTGTDGVKIASAQTVATVTNLTNLPTMPNDWVTAAGVKADAVTKIQNGLATSTEVGAIALLGETVVGSYTVQDILTILAAKTVGKATGGGTTTITYRGVDDTSNVVVETVDANGNRSAVTLTV